VNIELITTSEIRITCLIDESQAAEGGAGAAQGVRAGGVRASILAWQSRLDSLSRSCFTVRTR
jgi:hypothetical protein